VFRQPLGSGTTLDLNTRQCLDLDIVVDDQDSPEVIISQDDPVIEGATLDATSGLAANWNWCPTRAQIDADDRYTLTLGADDGDNPKVVKNYLVVLRPPDPDQLPGQRRRSSPTPRPTSRRSSISPSTPPSPTTSASSSRRCSTTRRPTPAPRPTCRR
jgi:hypothetical protein